MVQIRNLPDELFWMLNTEAKRQHRSLGQQAIALMARALSSETGLASKRLAVLAELKAERGMQQTWQSLSSGADLIRQDRDR